MRQILLIFCLAATILPCSARAQNLILNPDFDGNTDQWGTLSPSDSYSSFDFQNSADSGSVYYENEGAGNSGMPLAWQSVTISGSENMYRYSAMFYPASTSTAPGHGEVTLYWYADSGCSSDFLEAATGAFVSATESWGKSGGIAVKPAGAVCVKFYTINQRNDSGTFNLYVDHCSLVPMLFGDDFEDGTLDRWSFTSP